MGELLIAKNSSGVSVLHADVITLKIAAFRSPSHVPTCFARSYPIRTTLPDTPREAHTHTIMETAAPPPSVADRKRKRRETKSIPIKMLQFFEMKIAKDSSTVSSGSGTASPSNSLEIQDKSSPLDAPRIVALHPAEETDESETEETDESETEECPPEGQHLRCPCGGLISVYHFSWSAIQCSACRRLIPKKLWSRIEEREPL